MDREAAMLMRAAGLILGMLALAPSARAGDALFCELYAVGHFGNWYEVAGQREMRRILVEAKAWGFNRYGDWFDTLDCVDPFANDRQYDLGNALWDRKKTHFHTAQSLGLQTDLIITPNHVYRDQLKPEWLAETGGRVFGQLICPHRPGARQQILDNYRALFDDLAAAGVRLDAISAAPYDYGGCNCERCRPWILTFAELSRDIYEIARSSHPGVELHFIGWWWSAEEHRQFAEWMDKNAPNLATSIALHIPYDKTAVADVPLPQNCRRHAFVHIGYADHARPPDIYGRTGPVIAPDRLEQTVRDLKAQSVTGVVAYSEGIFDDVNKALLAGLFTERYRLADDVLLAYASRYFAADPAQARQWADWLRRWGEPYDVDAAGARESFRTLSGDPLDWRRRQWALKADMFAAHQQIGTTGPWTPERLGHVEAFWAAYETLNRGVYGLGPLRHSLGPTYIGLPWYKSWVEHERTAATQPGH
jgi:hypothetical protein